MLKFKSVSLADKEIVDKYFFKYGEGSCQHSFVPMFCNKRKYNDCYAVDDGCMFVIRKNLCTETENFYLFPMGEHDDDNVKKALDKIMDDAHKDGKKVRFQTITNTGKDILERLYSGRFDISPYRDYYEYIYTYEKMAFLKGNKLLKKRTSINNFYRDYDGRIEERIINKDDIEEMKKLHKLWYDQKNNDNNKTALSIEQETMDIGLENYDALNLNGIVIYVDHKLAGFLYGVKLNDDYYDALIEKADYTYKDIFKVLNREFARMCCSSVRYINYEEDVGEPGLRNLKIMYHPDILMEKYIAREV